MKKENSNIDKKIRLFNFLFSLNSKIEITKNDLFEINLNEKNYYVNKNFLMQPNEFNKANINKNFNANFIGMLLLIICLKQQFNEKVKIIDYKFNKKNFWVDFDTSDNFDKALFNKLKFSLKEIINNFNFVTINLNNSKFNFHLFNNVINKPINFAHLINLKIFKNLCEFVSKSGVYLENNKINKMVHRIYGICSKSESEFKKIKDFFLLSERHDHRNINNDIKLFTFFSEFGAGLPIILENGYKVIERIRQILKNFFLKENFKIIKTPYLANEVLYQQSGHMKNYSDSIFPKIRIQNNNLILRPMTCPHHALVFNSENYSYHDLPIAYYEDSTLFRLEATGALKGLERIRQMTLVDCHVFTTENLIVNDISYFLKKINNLLQLFNIKIKHYSLSIQDNSKKYVKSSLLWEKGVNILEEALLNLKIKYKTLAGEAAFYGPKIDIEIETSQNKVITFATIQCDLVSAKNLNISYNDKNNKNNFPLIIHIGFIGTYERFLSILMEQNLGYFPYDLNFLQFIIIPVNEKHINFCKKLHLKLLTRNFYSYLNNPKKQRLNLRIKNAYKLKANYYIVIGDDEIKTNKINVFSLRSKKQYSIDAEKLIDFAYSKYKINND